ncbi:MAG: HAD hydrolase-like protein [Simkaniaceae bacterium]|nr:HAD hydrolase-like protein [Simkaniaceae bacterium]
MLLIFDLDDTLIDTTGTILPHRRLEALKAMADDGFKIEAFDAAIEKFAEIDAESESGSDALKKFLGTKEEYFEAGKKSLYDNADFNFPIETTPKAREILEKLKKGHTLALVTYGQKQVQWAKLKKTGLDKGLFSTIVVTQDSDKGPSYHQIFEKYGGKGIVIGDRVKRDLTPAKRLGFTTVQMQWGRGKNGGDHPDVDYAIEQLEDLLPLLEGKEKI